MQDDIKYLLHVMTFPFMCRASLVQPEPESVSEVSFMETSNISGYRESFGGFDMSLQELERLEMQVS